MSGNDNQRHSNTPKMLSLGEALFLSRLRPIHSSEEPPGSIPAASTLWNRKPFGEHVEGLLSLRRKDLRER
jgi:hypothetical protein